MTTLAQALTLILDSVTPLDTELVELGSALGRVIAGEIVAPWDLPMVDNSAMDGYAVRHADCAPGASFRVTGFLPAGNEPVPQVRQGEAVKIMTGAPIPAGSDLVVPVEEAEERDGLVTFSDPVRMGQHIRLRGEDVRAGQTIAGPGTLIRPAEINMLASLGKALVPVYRRARVAVVATGDELVELGQLPEPGCVINSNSLALAAAIRELGAEPVMIGIARDDLDSHRRLLAASLNADAVITSAGVSAGDRDLVRDVLAELGVRQLFWKVKVKPGGPTAFGMKGTVPVFSLPGNPVSTLLTFEMLARPALLKLMGHRRLFKVPVRAILAEDARPREGKTTLLRVRLSYAGGAWSASSSGDQKTSFLRTQVAADGIVLLAPGKETLPAGSEVGVLVLGERQWLAEC
ncbi:MAG: molybdopterin molybdotransferase MoeA [Geobacter sp.]|nr:molybdopterin molybdotransferase MoeA [Geobacter sp.]